jgi:hypothetical protein
MPTLIRLVIFLLFLAGIGYAGMFALAVMVDPGVREVVTPIPTEEFRPNTSMSANLPRPVVTSEPENTAGNSAAPGTAPANTAAPIAPGADEDIPE